jgi:flagellar basal body P-ring protein FlgI
MFIWILNFEPNVFRSKMQKDSEMDDQEITWEVVQQLNDAELSDLLKDEADLDLSPSQIAAIRQFIKIAGDLDSALELVSSVRELKDAA